MIEKEDLTKFKIFDGLSFDELDRIMLGSQEGAFKNGEVLFEESNLSSDLFILLKGRVSIEIEVPYQQGYRREQLLLLRAGEIFGEIAFLEGSRRSAYVIALDDIRILKIDKKMLNELFSRDNHIGYLVMRNLAVILAQRLIDTNFKWREDMR